MPEIWEMTLMADEYPAEPNERRERLSRITPDA
jgi:hypothetical protein